ncbi:MAG: glycosyltransferase family 4 protein [Planctomycetes bacterium]|nr:glycosyltransferase family 4 protein [Planctomycetota bacterium]
MTRRRSIGIDVRAALRGPCGIGRVAVELAQALARLDPALQVVLYGASRHGRDWAAPLPCELLDLPNVRLFAPRLPAKLLQWAARMPGFATDWLTGPLDAFLHTDLVYVAGLRCPQLVIVHDLAFEVSRDFHEEGFHEPARARLSAAIDTAAALIVPSAATRDDLVSRWHVASERITVVPLGCDHVLRGAAGQASGATLPRFERPTAAPRAGYFVHVGTLEPRKNLPRLVRAYRAARAQGLAQELVLVGAWGWKREELERELARCGSDAPVTVRGAVPEAELLAWLAHADALVYPSLWEGFGLPVAEAFALGVPVITSNRSSTREVAGDAALLIDPESEPELAAALLRLGRDAALRAELAVRGQERARRYTWEAMARGVRELVERVVASGRR